MSKIQVKKEVLPNGLTVLVAEQHTSPVVAINLWVRAGYFDEDDQQVGISHVIEHMFFKGTEDRPRPDQIATEIKNLGGELNASTYYDATNYYFVLPSENFRKGLEIQADALMHPKLEPEELKRELEAVIQEGRRKRDTPGAFAHEMLFNEAFETHRIRRWRIGAEEALRALTRDDLLAYYRMHYVPGRVILSIVGNIQTGEALETAHIFLGGMPQAEGAALGSPPEPPQDRFKHSRLTGDIRRGYIFLGYHTPPILSEDDFALRILGHILGSGRSSRLFQAVKEEAGLVESIGTSLESFRDIGMLTVVAEHDPANGPEAVQAIQAQIEQMHCQLPYVTEIERARAAIEFRYQVGRSEVLGLSTLLAYYESLGGYALAEEAVERLARVEAADVKRVAETYLKLDNATLLEYVPEDDGGAAQVDPSALLDSLRRVQPAGPREEPPAGRGSGVSPERSAPQAARIAHSETQGGVARHRFDSGSILLYEQRRDLPLVTLSVAFRGGRSGEGRENSGITKLMQSSIVRGGPGRDARQVVIEIEGMGSAIEKIVDDDYFGFSISLLARHARRGFELLMDLVRRPAFRYEEIERERSVLLAAQESIKDQSLPYTFQLFKQAAFGSHPYSLPAFGLQAPVRALKREDLVRWHRLMVRPASMVVSVVGDLEEEKVIDMVAESLYEWVDEGYAGKDPGQLLGWGASEVVETRRRHQTAQVIGFPTPGFLAPDRFALDLIRAITSGLGGRFFEEVRGKRGLAYAVSGFNFHRVRGGAFGIYLATSPQHEGEARRVLFREISRLRAEGPRIEELSRAARSICGLHAIVMQGNCTRSLSYLDVEVRGIGFEAVHEYPEKIASVGLEDIQDAIWRYLDPDRCAIGILRGDEPLP
jgi:zinc protease